MECNIFCDIYGTLATIFFIIYLFITGTMHINKHFCQYARFSQMAIFHLQSLNYIK